MTSKTTYVAGGPPEGNVETYAVTAGNNRVTGWSYTPYYGWPEPETYTYDAAGNQLGQGRTYDRANRLTGSTGLGYLYDGNSRRFRKAVGSTRTYYVYSAQGQLLVEEDWAAGTSSNQVYFNGQLVATHGQDEYVRFVFKDHLGSTRSIATVTPPEGGNNWGYDWETTAVFDYNPFGDYASSSNQDPQSSRARFTGKEREDNGLDYFGARYYDSNRTQRWISPDPITSRIYDPPSPYVRNDPVNLVDPDGRDPEPFTIRITSSAPAYPREDGGTDSLSYLNKIWILGLIKTGAEMDLPSFDVETPEDPVGDEQYRAECDRSNTANARVLDFIAAHKSDAQKIGSSAESVGKKRDEMMLRANIHRHLCRKRTGNYLDLG